MDSVLVERLRRFNRTVTQRVGALDDAFLSRSRPLGQARLLWEIGADTCEVRSLRSRLGLDSGYLSRLLGALQADGLVLVETDDTDGRIRTARLTPAGVAERAELDRRADELAVSILDPLSDQQRGRLVAAMGEVERLLVASMVRVDVTDPRHPDARHCARAYFAELGRRFVGGFDPATTHAAPDEELTAPAGLLLVATLHADPVGSVALRLGPGHNPGSRPGAGSAPGAGSRPGSSAGSGHSAGHNPGSGLGAGHSAGPGAGLGFGEVTRMWVAPAVRGLGLGRRLLTTVEAHAAARGVRTLRLETNRALTEAIALYRATGYQEVAPFNDEPYAHHWFSKNLEPPKQKWQE